MATGAERVKVILSQLGTGDDAPTGQEFKLSADGSLASAPTRRLALLNELTRLDPKAAAAYAAKILREFKSSDEWAVALRAYALANPTLEGRGLPDRAISSDGRARAVASRDRKSTRLNSSHG